MITESLVGVFVVLAVAYLYWKSIEKDNVVLPPVTEKDDPVVDLENVEFEEQIGPTEIIRGVAEEVVEPAVKPKRARKKDGKFIGDDKSTDDINEAWIGGKAPAKQTKPKATKAAKPKTTETPVKKPRTRKPKMTVLK